MTTPAPILGYDDRYFLDCQYTKEELFELQNQILFLIDERSSDIEKDLKTKINHKEIDLCLRKCYSKQLIKRERLGVENEVPVYRYYVN